MPLKKKAILQHEGIRIIVLPTICIPFTFIKSQTQMAKNGFMHSMDFTPVKKDI